MRQFAFNQPYLAFGYNGGSRGRAVMTLKEIAGRYRLEIVSDADFQTLGFLSDSLPGMLVFLEDRKFLGGILGNQCVAAVLTTAELAREIPSDIAIAVTVHPRRDFVRIQNILVSETEFYGEHRPSLIDASATIDPRAAISPQDVTIGAEVVVEANVTIGPGCELHRGALVKAGSVLGSSGFQTCRDESGYLEMLHGGTLIIEERAQIFSNATIARGLTRQCTRIGMEARVGNNAFVSHNVEIGERSFVGHSAVVNGNTRVGSRVWIGPGAIVANNLTIGDEARVSLGAVVIRSVAAHEHVSGNFAISHKRLLRRVATA